MYNLLFYWIITVIIEFLVLCLFIKKEPSKLFLVSILINSVTLPLATFIYLFFYPNFVLIEVAVFLVEIFLVRLLLEVEYKESFLISLAANLATALFGLIFSIIW